MRRLPFALALVLVAAFPCRADVPYPVDPGWRSFEYDDYGTGCDFADVDGDGFLDLAVSNGNDMSMAPSYLYRNAGGALPTHASWTSGDAHYGGHCAFGDIDADGLPELMVANLFAAAGELGSVQLYDNVAGALTAAPTWESPRTFSSFRAAFGDPDGDGDLDLAVAAGDDYTSRFAPNLVFFNAGGTLQSTPGWTSADVSASYDIQFVDIDNDGDQDLAVLEGGIGRRAKIYYNEGGQLGTTPGWVSGFLANGNTFDFDDLDGDGYRDLAVHYNTYFDSVGVAAIYWNHGGRLDDQPGWLSEFNGYGSAIVCADVSNDGLPDLIAGSWWGQVRIYLNRGGSFPTAPDWQNSLTSRSVVENFALADLDERGTRSAVATFPAGSGPHLQLPHRHLQRIAAVAVDGVDLPRAAWCGHPRDGWVSLAGAAPDGAIQVRYRWSPAPDLAVTNWDTSTYIFFNRSLTPVADPATPGAPAIAALAACPNPFNPRTTFTFDLTAPAVTRLTIYDAAGRVVDALCDGGRAAGRHQIAWTPRGLASGVYLYRLEAGGEARSGRVVLAK